MKWNVCRYFALAILFLGFASCTNKPSGSGSGTTIPAVVAETNGWGYGIVSVEVSAAPNATTGLLNYPEVAAAGIQPESISLAVVTTPVNPQIYNLDLNPNSQTYNLNTTINSFDASFDVSVDFTLKNGHIITVNYSVLVGDFNSDHVVNQLDFNILYLCFATYVNSPSTPSYCKVVDLDNNGFVSQSDFNLFMVNYRLSMCPTVDYNSDGIVNSADFSIFSGTLTQANPPSVAMIRRFVQLYNMCIQPDDSNQALYSNHTGSYVLSLFNSGDEP